MVKGKSVIIVYFKFMEFDCKARYYIFNKFIRNGIIKSFFIAINF